jgi:hypothetical protein
VSSLSLSVRRAAVFAAAFVALSALACSRSGTSQQQSSSTGTKNETQKQPQNHDADQSLAKKSDDGPPPDKKKVVEKTPVEKAPVEKTPVEKAPKGPVVVSPEKLGQDLTDDITKNYPRYFGSVLQIKGVVHKRTEDKGAIVRVDFQVPIKLKDGKADDFVVFCGLKSPVKLKDPAAADLAEGKTVTIRGKLSAGGNGQATLHDCEVVRE